MDKSRRISGITGHALVLGGSGGLGAEIVRTLASSGASAVSFTYGRNKKAADELVAELRADGIKAFAAPADLSDEPGFNKVLDDAVANIGQEISLAINSIGISPNIPIEEQTLDGPDGWRRVFEINVFGCFISTRAIAERMKKRGVKGSIVLVTSTNGINSQSQISTHYDSSKAAQGHMMKIFAEHYAPAGVRINGVAPGMDRNQHERHAAGRRACARNQQDLGRPLRRTARDCIVHRVRRRCRRLLRRRAELHGGWRLSLSRSDGCPPCFARYRY